MPDQRPHRKTVKHYERALQARLLTFSCYRRRPILLDPPRPELVGQALANATRARRWVPLAWVFMPEHVHIVAVPWHGASEVAALLAAIKRPSSFRIKQALIAAGDALLDELTVRERPSKEAFRFWQEGPGHDRNIRSYDQLLHAVTYVHENPVRRRLCAHPTEWRWSSARQWAETPLRPEPARVVCWSVGAGLMWDGPEAWFGAATAAASRPSAGGQAAGATGVH